MTELFVKLHLFLARHRGSVLLLAGLFAVVAVLLSRRLKLNEDFTDMLPMSDPAIAEQVGALKHIRQADRLYVDVQTATTIRPAWLKPPIKSTRRCAKSPDWPTFATILTPPICGTCMGNYRRSCQPCSTRTNFTNLNPVWSLPRWKNGWRG